MCACVWRFMALLGGLGVCGGSCIVGRCVCVEVHVLLGGVYVWRFMVLLGGVCVEVHGIVGRYVCVEVHGIVGRCVCGGSWHCWEVCMCGGSWYCWEVGVCGGSCIFGRCVCVVLSCSLLETKISLRFLFPLYPKTSSSRRCLGNICVIFYIYL